MSIRRSLIVAMENAEHRSEDTAILTEVEDLKIEGEIKDAEKQVVELSAENERVSDAIDEAIDDVEQVEEIQEQVEEVGGEQGISAESYAFVQAQANRIFTKYGINQSMPSMESFNGYSGDRKHATKQLTASLEDGKEGIFKKIWDTLVRWAVTAWEAVKGFFRKLKDGFKRSYESVKTRIVNIKNYTLSKFKLAEGVAFKLLINKEGKLISSEAEFQKQIDNTFALCDALLESGDESLSIKEGIESVRKNIDNLINGKKVAVHVLLVSAEADDSNVSAVSKLVEGVTNTSKEMIGGQIVYLVASDPKSVKAGIFAPDVDYSGNPVEVFAMSQTALQNNVEGFHSRVLKLEQLQIKNDKMIKSLKTEGDKILKVVSNSEKEAVKMSISYLRANIDSISKFCTKFGRDAVQFVKYANKALDAAEGKSEEETKAE